MDTVCLHPLWPVICVQMLWAMNLVLNSALALTVLFSGRARVGRNQCSSRVKKPDFMTDLSTRQKLCSTCVSFPRALALEMLQRWMAGPCARCPALSAARQRRSAGDGWQGCCSACRVINCYILLPPSETQRKDPTTPNNI